MHKIALLTLGLAGALSPAFAFAPAPPSPPAAPASPAGISWRNQAAPAPQPYQSIDDRQPTRRQFLIRRDRDEMSDSDDLELERELEDHLSGAPARVIIRRQPRIHLDEHGHDRHIHGGHLEHGHDDHAHVDHDRLGHEHEEHDDYGYADDDLPGGDDWADGGYLPAHHRGHGVHPGCCSGGMITETITTTTTYPPTVERHVVREQVRHHPLARKFRKVRRR